MRLALAAVLVLSLAASASASPVMRGIGSWYGSWFEGRPMADGCRYHARRLSAAHRTLPLGSVVRVLNVRNGHMIDVVVTDRGPYVRGRMLDLSRAAFARLDKLSAGVVMVEMMVVANRPAVHRRCR